jgi:ATP adenylyltransferase
LCAGPAAGDDARSFIVHRGRHCFVVLNAYPYTSGHLMVAPYAHVASLTEADEASVSELMLLTRTAQGILGAAYRAPGFNLGMNLGQCAGAGVAGHIHMHVLPRWPGDTNFMTVTGETRVMPEDLQSTYEKLRGPFSRL